MPGACSCEGVGELPVFLSQSKGMCRQCRQLVPVRYVAEDNQVYLERLCPEHGKSRVLVAESLCWYLDAMQKRPAACPPGPSGQARAADGPERGRDRDAVRSGGGGACPESCGPCGFHGQICQLPVFSVTNVCDLRCPICFTYNREDRQWFMSPDEFSRQLDFVVAQTGGVDLINVTGGEPTCHPQLPALLERAKRPDIGRITMNTNGLRLARDPELVRWLSDLGVYVVLSLDTLDEACSLRLHGKDITQQKQQALAQLERFRIPTTLLMVLVGGVNENELPCLLELFVGRSFVRSLTIQTMTYTGQGGGSFQPRQHIPVDRVERLIEESSGGQIRKSDFVPLPTAHPLCYGVSYLVVDDAEGVFSFLDILDADVLMQHLTDGYLMHPSAGLESELKAAIDRVWSEDRHPGLLKALKRMLQQVYPAGENLGHWERQRRAERTVKTIYVHAHMDEDTWEMGRAMRCPDQVPGDGTKLIGACNYNLFYRQRDERFWVKP